VPTFVPSLRDSILVFMPTQDLRPGLSTNVPAGLTEVKTELRLLPAGLTELKTEFWIKKRQTRTAIALLDADLAQQFEVAEHLAGAEDDAGERVVGDGDRKTSFFANTFI
jgi:hypothetical protein